MFWTELVGCLVLRSVNNLGKRSGRLNKWMFNLSLMSTVPQISSGVALQLSFICLIQASSGTFLACVCKKPVQFNCLINFVFSEVKVNQSELSIGPIRLDNCNYYFVHHIFLRNMSLKNVDLLKPIELHMLND